MLIEIDIVGKPSRFMNTIGVLSWPFYYVFAYKANVTTQINNKYQPYSILCDYNFLIVCVIS